MQSLNNCIRAACGRHADFVNLIDRSNEPDHPEQANLTPAQAAQVYKNYINPLNGLGAKLCTPAVTNGVGSYGLDYLEKFVGACSDCVFNVINIHHYVQRSDLDVDGAVRVLKEYIDHTVPAVQKKHPQLQGLKLFLGEVGAIPIGDTQSAAITSTFSSNTFFVDSSGSGMLPKQKAPNTCRRSCHISTTTPISWATKLSVACGKVVSSMPKATGLRRPDRFIETFESLTIDE